MNRIKDMSKYILRRLYRFVSALSICVVNSRDFLVKKALDNPPFQPYYSIPHTMSFQKMHILWTGQFSPKKNLSQGNLG